MKNLQYFDNGYIVDPEDEGNKRYKILYMSAEYDNDRENLPGVSRIVYGVDIECAGHIPSNLKSEAETELFNALADREYFDEDPDCEKKAARDLSMLTGVPKDKINVVFG